MQATLTQIHREAKRVFRPVQAGQRVRITEHAKPIASIVPDCERKVVLLEDFFKSDISDAAIVEAVQESRA